MKYDEDQIKALIVAIKAYQNKLKDYNHKDIDQYIAKLNITLVRVILSVVYNNHLPSTIITSDEEARNFIVDILGEEVTNLVGKTDAEWKAWINKSIHEQQKFPYNIINKIKNIFTK